jgi:hypothetical protein
VTTLQALLAYLAPVPLVVVVAALIARRRAARCWAFFAHVLAAMIGPLLMVRWPEQFWNYPFYSVKETVQFVLLAFVAFEMWRRTFAALPRARVRVGFLLLGGLMATAAAVLTIPIDRPGYDTVVTIEVPRMHAGNLALFALMAFGVRWYRVPVHPFYRAVLGGLGIALTVDVLSTSLLGWLLVPDPALIVVSHLNAGTYVLVSLWWAWSAWRPERVPEPIISTLQPWAQSW